jgi:hypothetical protein
MERQHTKLHGKGTHYKGELRGVVEGEILETPILRVPFLERMALTKAPDLVP